MTKSDVIRRHEQFGWYVTVDGVDTFLRSTGDGEPVLCLHGVPASSFLYRNVLDSLRDRGFQGISFDLPGLGLSGRPADYDYTWSGLGRFSKKLVETLELNAFHLVVHDIGGPIGFELIHHKPDAVKSLTLLNTMTRVAEFNRPWPMEPFAHSLLGDLWLAGMIKPVFRLLMYRFGLEDNNCIPTKELNAYVDLLKREDGGEAFLKIMRGFERTSEKQTLYENAIRNFDGPKSVVWGANDPALPLDPFAQDARDVTGVDRIVELEGRHFLQEEYPEQIADEIESLAQGAGPHVQAE